MTDTPDMEQQIDNVPLLKPIKEKKPRSEKQLKSFAACSERLKERHRVQLHDKKVKAAKFLLDHDIKPTIPEPVKVKEEPIIVKEESSDEEVIYLKREKVKTSKKKPKVKTIILSSSESESESESEEEIIQPIPEKKFISQQNKKSLIKIHKIEPNKKNYFAD